MAKKSILPIVALAAGAVVLLASGKSSAKSTSTIPPLDSGTIPGNGQEMPELPPPDNSDQQDPKDNSWNVKPESGPITAEQKQAIDAAMYFGGSKVDSTYYPYPYNARKQGQSMLDWKTDLAFWTLYSTSQSPWVLSGHKAVPFKITESTPDAKKWAAIWLKLRNYIAMAYPDVEVNEKYTVNNIKTPEIPIPDFWPFG